MIDDERNKLNTEHIQRVSEFYGRGSQLWKKLDRLAGWTIHERLASLLIVICAPVVLWHLVAESRPDRLIEDIFGILRYATPWDYRWEDGRAIALASKGLVFALIVRFLVRPILRWSRRTPGSH